MTKRKVEKDYKQMPVLNHHAAGIDVGSREHYVAVGQGREHVKKFGVYTSDLKALCEWLLKNSITTVALESTGSYWKNLFIMLQQHGLNPILVNGSFTKNLKGRKTDVIDCQFIQLMHTLGLLPDSFQPDDFTGQLRNIVRHRSSLISQVADNVKRIAQSLRLMNIRLDVAVSDITGKSGMSIIKAIISGERDAAKLAQLCDVNVKKSKEEIALALSGFYRNDYLFQLKQLKDVYDFLQQQIQEADTELNAMLDKHLSYFNKNDLLFEQKKKDKKRIQKNAPAFDVDRKSFQLFDGVNLMDVPGISYSTVLIIMSEVGESISKFSSAKAFSNWLRLTPNKKITGGKVIGNSIRHGANVLSIALRNAANTIGNMKKDIPLSRFFKRLAFKYGRAAAITATARKLAVIIWNMITKAQSFIQPSMEVYDNRIRQATLKNIQRKISALKIKPEDLSFINV
jgi:transposase